MIRCPSCGSVDVLDRGQIADAKSFAGRRLSHSICGGHFYDCSSCHLSFRWPVLSVKEYDALYSAGKTTTWDITAERIDHQLALQAIKEVCSIRGDVLDVGCGAGTLLSQLSEHYRKFGIEIGAEARHLAKMRNIILVGSTFGDLTNSQRLFDVIVATDVIEHHPEPLRFLTDCLSCLRPQGHLIVSTGDRSSLLWRILKNRFWYCLYAEHLVYLSPDWFRQVSQNRYTIVKIKRFSYAKLGVTRWTKHCAAMAAYYLMPITYQKLMMQRSARRNGDFLSPPAPGAGLTKDHFLVILRKR